MKRTPVVMAYDPGPRTSGAVEYDVASRRVTAAAKEMPTADMLRYLRSAKAGHALTSGALHAFEDFEPRGMPCGHDICQSLKLIGHLQEIAPNGSMFIPRQQIKLALCGSSRANDANVRAAVIRWFAGRHNLATERDVIGRKASPGPCYGVSSHAWQALAVALVAAHGTDLMAKRPIGSLS